MSPPTPANQTERTTILVANLAAQANEQELRKLFEKFGAVSEVRLVADPSQHRGCGSCLVTMDATPAKAAINALNDSAFMGTILSVSVALPSEPERGTRKPKNDDPPTALSLPRYRVISVEKADMPSGGEGADWYRYVLSSGRSEITGFHRGTREEVDAYARQCAEEYNERSISGSGKRTMAPLKKKT